MIQTDGPQPSLASRAMMVCAGRAGVPMEVMGLMLGEFVDDYTVKVRDTSLWPRVCL